MKRALILLLFLPLLNAQEIVLAPPLAEIAAAPSPKKLFDSSKLDAPKDGYTINYNTISIIEYIRFASKICNINFLFNEEDLNFTVTVLSEGPITPENVMSTLVQILRINGLQLLEQDNNLVIHKSSDVKQIAKLVTETGQGGRSPIVTRIFRIKNAKAESIAAVIRPMISQVALLEVSAETRQLILTDVTANVDKVASLIENLDSPHTQLQIRTYEVQNNKPEYLIEVVSQIMAPLAVGNPYIIVPAILSDSVFIVSTPELADKTVEVLKGLDVPPKATVLASRKLNAENIFVYKLEQRNGEEVVKGLANIADTLKKSGVPSIDLLQSIQSAKWIPETNSIMVVGSKDSIDKIKEFLVALDAGKGLKAFGRNNFFVYPIKTASYPQIEAALKAFASDLDKSNAQDGGLVDAVGGMKYIPETNSILFTGSEGALKRVQEIVPTFDSGIGSKSPTSSQFYIYKPKYQKGDQLVASIKEVVDNFKANNLSDPALLRALQTMKWVKSTNSVLFTGDAISLKKVEDLLATLDVPTGLKQGSEKNFYIYTLQYVTKERTNAYLKQVADNLNKRNDEDLINTLRTATWLEPSNSYMFNGTNDALERIKELLASFDKAGTANSGKTGYFIYKLQTASGDAIEDDLDMLAKNLKSSGHADSKVLEVIDNIRYVKETNSLLLTGDQQAIDEVKQMIAKYDYPREAQNKSNFFMYKPQHVTAATVQKSLQDISTSLKQGGLADQILLNTIDSAKYVETTNSIIFTGSPDTLVKIQSLLKDIDVPAAKHAPIQHIGKTTFLLYKLKNAGGTQIVTSLKAMGADLKKSGTSDKDFLSALNTMKYVKETNSLLFTGTEDSLKKVETFVEKFDVTSLSGPARSEGFGGSSNFFVYNPKSLPGPELEKLLQDFAENLKLSGLADPDLFNSVASMRWVDKTQSLIFTGNPKALDRIKELLQSFDIPSNLPNGPIPGGPLEPSIQAIDNTSFLVYKLQFHKGDEIQGALRQIAKDLILSNAQVNQNLLNSINSIQWLEVTNSLLCSGDQETLTRLRELVKNLDIPLKQVFIEMLVVQTNLTNALTFGLEWAGNYKYRDKFSTAFNNATAPGPATGLPDTFTSNVGKVNPSLTPNPTMIPFTPAGFELGVIGEVIRHGGDTYLSLGSLLNALQTDDETTIVMTPKLITQDGRTSSIFSGMNIPFAGSFVSNTSGTSTVSTSNIEYRDIGLNLTITPVLGNSDIVTLDISLDQSTAPANAANQQITVNGTNTAVVNGITTTKTTMQTTVHVPDDHFLILSGMVNNSTVKSKSGIPCLGGLPIIGAAFSKDNTTVSNNNIVIFLRPHILSSMDDLRSITKAQEEFFRDQAGTPNLEHVYDESMELIKSVDDE
jgi:type II secretory pathway component GspD/PulD (secretin)